MKRSADPKTVLKFFLDKQKYSDFNQDKSVMVGSQNYIKKN